MQERSALMGASDMVSVDSITLTNTPPKRVSLSTPNRVFGSVCLPQYGRNRLSSVNFSLNIEQSSRNSTSKLSSVSEIARQDTRVVNEAFQVFKHSGLEKKSYRY
jgi:hypothetical protein